MRSFPDIPVATHRVLVSCDEDSQPFVEGELREVFPNLTIDWLVVDSGQPSGVGVVTTAADFAAFAAIIEETAPFFIRHIAPIQRQIALHGDDEDLDRLRQAASELADLLQPSHSFSVQSRLLGEEKRSYQRVGLNQALYDAVALQTDAPLDARNPDQTLSVVCTADTAYLGISWTWQNRSPWPGGQRRFRREEEQISRAEFKLLEAIEVFELQFPATGVALDIGAAPGGWTRVLRQQGLRVVAVDPADLHERLRRDPKVIHIRERVQRYQPTERFDGIVNDMKMDAFASIDMLLALEPHLKEGGIAVITLKLPKSVRSSQAMLRFIREDLKRLQTRFTLIGARQLFHNRQEITVALTK